MIKVNSAFDGERAARIARSAFDLSHEKKFTCDMGQVIPILAMMALPGDIVEIGNSCILRMQPMLAPLLHQVDVEVFYFADPIRLVDDTFEDFITKGLQGTTTITPPLFDPSLFTTPANVIAQGSLWDFLGFPLLQPPSEACPNDWVRRVYYHIWNEYFRDERIDDAIDFTTYGTNHDILRARWKKDYFTSAQLNQQAGTAPALPVFGTANILMDVPYSNNVGGAVQDLHHFHMTSGNQNAFGTTVGVGGATTGSITASNSPTEYARMQELISENTTVNGDSFTSVDIADFRLTLAIQVWMERNQRGGSRYTEILQSHFGIGGNLDVRLQRPEFIGATKSHAIFSEVLQTSSTDAEPTPQGNLAGHGIAVQSSGVGKYRVDEFSIIMGLMVVRPKGAYQDGINRQWLWRTPYDFPWPEFAGLSEQEIFNAELCTISVADDPDGSENLGIFGYTGRYNEMRYMPDLVCSEMRDTFDYWHLGRKFDPASPPQLDSTFLECNPRKDIFAVSNVPGLIVSFGNRIQALRPLPFMPIPNTMGV